MGTFVLAALAFFAPELGLLRAAPSSTNFLRTVVTQCPESEFIEDRLGRNLRKPLFDVAHTQGKLAEDDRSCGLRRSDPQGR